MDPDPFHERRTLKSVKVVVGKANFLPSSAQPSSTAKKQTATDARNWAFVGERDRSLEGDKDGGPVKDG